MSIVVGDTTELQASFLSTWMHRADAKVQSSPEAHVAEMVRVALKGGILRPVDGKVSDGFHTFDELYRHRMLLNAALFNRLAAGADADEFEVHKSMLHSDGEAPFGGGWFIVVAQLPSGQVSYHHELDHWDLFDVPEWALAEVWDGHTSVQAADRLEAFVRGDR